VSGRVLVDLSMPVAEEMPTNRPDHFPPTMRQYSTIDTAGWAGTALTIDTHCGTHVDAPVHFVPGGRAVADIPLSTLIGDCQVVRIPTGGPDGAIVPDQLGEITAERVVLDTGWSERLATDEEGYFRRHSYLHPDTARRLVAEGVRLVGIDTPSVDRVDDQAHHILLGSDVVIVENLSNTGRLPDRVELVVAPLRLTGADGSPARVIALAEGVAG
jgi:arylformamidase